MKRNSPICAVPITINCGVRKKRSSARLATCTVLVAMEVVRGTGRGTWVDVGMITVVIVFPL
jgi:hypothetical protein